MKFRTEIGPLKGSFEIGRGARIVLIGSCFADNIGERLVRDGFSAVHNPLGPLFNPVSVARNLARGIRPYGEDDFFEHQGIWHCLDFANRYQDSSAEKLAQSVNAEYMPFAQAIADADVIIVTLGTSKVYRLTSDYVAGNCHKLPGTMFSEAMLSVDEAVKALQPALTALAASKHIILTLSPVRYPGEGLAKGFLAKATLRVAIDHLCNSLGLDYFPAFEIVNDDLRDYRFYAADMRHPSEVAVDYIYDNFCEAYFCASSLSEAAESRRQYIRAAHRPNK